MQEYSIELDKIQELLEKNPQGLTLQDISKQIKINRNSVAKYMDVLHMSGNASMKKIGPAKMFFSAKRVPIENMINYSKDFFVVIDNNKQIVDINDSFLNFLGRTKEVVISKKITDIKKRCNFDKEGMMRISKCIDQALLGKEGTTELHCEKKKWFNTKFIPTKINNKTTGVTVILEDVTISKTTRKELEKINTELNEERKLFLKGPVIIFKWLNKPNWPVEYVSSNVKEVLGYDEKQFMSGKIKYIDLIHKDDFLRVSYEARTSEQKEIEQFEHKPYRLKRKDGKIIWVNVNTLIVRDKEGKITHNLCYIIDVTKFFELAKEIEF